MAKFNHIQNSFAAGELTPKINGRSDLKLYNEGLSELRNMITQRFGGAIKRNGSKFLSRDTSLISSSFKLIPFVYSRTEWYIIVITGTYAFAVYDKNLSAVETGLVLPNFASGNITSYVQVGNILILCREYSEPICIYREDGKFQCRHYSYFLSRKTSTNTFLSTSAYLSIPFDDDNIDSKATVYANGTGTTTLVAEYDGNYNPIFEATNSNLTHSYFRFTQPTGSTPVFKTALFKVTATPTLKTITSIDEVNERLVISGGHNFYSYSVVYFAANSINPIPSELNASLFYIIKVIDATSFEVYKTREDAIAGTNKITFAAQTPYVDVVPYKVPVVTVDTIIAAVSVTSSNKTSRWALPQWSVQKGFPNTVTIVGGRLIFGGNKEYPDRVWASSTKNFFYINDKKLAQDDGTGTPQDQTLLNFFGAYSDLDPFITSTGASEFNAITSLTNGTGIEVATEGGVYVITSGNNGGLSQTNNFVNNLSYVGIAPIRGVKVENDTILVSSDRKKLYRVSYTGKQEPITEVSAFSEHLFSNIKQIEFQRSENILWILETDGTLIALSLNSISDVKAFSKNTLVGITEITQILVLPSSTGKEDELYIIDKNKAILKLDSSYLIDYYRDTGTINSTTFSLTDDTLSMYRSTSGVAYTSTGSWITWTSTATTLTFSQSVVSAIFGLKYTCRIKSMNLDAGGQFGSSIGSIKRVDEVAINIINSGDFKYGSSDTNLITISGTNYTGQKVVKFPASPDHEAYVIIEQTNQYPLNITSMVYKGLTVD